jgi:cobalt transporter subunit CbtA
MKRIFTEGCKAGTIAGLIWGLMLLGFVSPIIQTAEKYEETAQKSEVHDPSSHHHHSHGNSPTVEFEPNAWQRPILTVLGSTLMGIAFGLLLSLSISFGIKFKIFSENNLHRPVFVGALIGVFGFLIFQGIPSLGLSPALPGIVGAEHDYEARQSWWMLSVVCSTFGIISFVAFPKILGNKLQGFHATLASLVLAVGFILAPFVYGVPNHSIVSVVPSSLQSHFIWVSTTVNMSFWLLLGSVLFFFVSQGNQESSKLANATA